MHAAVTAAYDAMRYKGDVPVQTALYHLYAAFRQHKTAHLQDKTAGIRNVHLFVSLLIAADVHGSFLREGWSRWYSRGEGRLSNTEFF